MTPVTEIDAYFENVAEPARTTLQTIRRITQETAPDAVELIAYGMPGFKYRGKPLLYYAAAKNHCALYGLSTDRAEQAGYDTSKKGTIRFPPDAPPPDSLLQELLTMRLQDIEATTSKPAKAAARTKA